MLKRSTRTRPPVTAPANVPAPPANDTPPMTEAAIEIELVATPDPIVDCSDKADKEQTGQASHHRTNDVAQNNYAVGGDANELCRAGIAADDVDTSPHHALVQDEREQGEQQREGQQIDWDPYELAGTKIAEARGKRAGRRALCVVEPEALKYDHHG